MFKLLAKGVPASLAILALAGCATFGGKGGDERAAAVDPRAVVQSAGLKTPVVSRWGQAFWVDLAKSDKPALAQASGHLAAGNPKRAARAATAYLEKHPRDVGMTAILSAALALSGEFDRAALYADLVLERDERNADARNVKALGIMMSPKARLADFGAAEALLKDALRLQPRHVAARLNLGYLYLAMGSSPQAQAAFSEAAARCNDCRPALIGLGVAAARLGQLTVAGAAFERVLSANPKDAEAAYHLAVVYVEGRKDQAKAREVLAEVVGKKGGSASGVGDPFRERAERLYRDLSPRRADSVFVSN